MVEKPQSDWESRHKVWLDFVSKVIETFEAGSALPVGPFAVPVIPPEIRPSGAPGKKVVLCSPHPDDEALVGALALRLRLESGARVVNCAITLGENKAERPRRLAEVTASCAALGFRLIVLNHPHGLDSVRPNTRSTSPAEWAKKVRALSEVLDQEKPDIVFLPHAEDFHPAHLGTHHLALDALAAHLKQLTREPVMLVETEYWHELPSPNLMIGVSPEVEAALLMAVAEHGGEVARNPYHIRHPARLIDNVRRGSEVVGGVGAAACTFPFAELYRVSFMAGKNEIAPREGGRIVGPTERIDPAQLVGDFLPGNWQQAGQREAREEK